MTTGHYGDISLLCERVISGRRALNIDSKRSEYEALQEQIQNPDLWNDPDQARELMQRSSHLLATLEKWDDLLDTSTTLLELSEALDASDLSDIEPEIQSLRDQVDRAEIDLLFQGKYDEQPAIIELYAGAGGTDAQDFCEMLLRMYERFSEKQSWSLEILEASAGSEAGLKSATVQVKGPRAYGLLQGEKGTHRLVRQSPFNAKALRQTSFCGVVVSPIIPPKDTTITLDESDLRIDTYRASGAGGQHVNTTDSAVRITHLPTGIVATCQTERSQHQNKERALQVLQSKLQLESELRAQQEAAQARGEVTEAAWGTQVRNYVLHPYKLVKDTRTHLERSDPDTVLDGDILDFCEAYIHWRVSGEHADEMGD